MHYSKFIAFLVVSCMIMLNIMCKRLFSIISHIALCTSYLAPMQSLRRVLFAWWEVPEYMRGVWKSTAVVYGVLCAMTFGTSEVPTLYADSSVTVELHFYAMDLTLVVAVVQSTISFCRAVGMRHAWLTATIVVIEQPTAVIQRMQEWCVQPLLDKVNAEFVLRLEVLSCKMYFTLLHVEQCSTDMIKCT